MSIFFVLCKIICHSEISYDDGKAGVPRRYNDIEISPSWSMERSSWMCVVVFGIARSFSFVG